MSEESAPDTDPAAGRLWVIDPLDGTNNHRVGRNYAAVSVAYVEHGAAVAAAVYDPYRDELYAATAGGGATRNGRPLRLTTGRPLAAAAILTDNGYDPAVTRFNLGLYLRLDPSPWVLVRGSAVLGLCDVAGGRADLYFHTALKPWDVAAAALVVREAGGVMTAFDGRPAGLTDSAAVAGPADLVSEFLRQVGLPDTPRRTP
jgi:myo-inositol-1(or 4)-monophosphatase